MGIHDYMAVGRKLSIEDDRSNLIAGLIVTTVVLSGCFYLSYQLAKERNKKIALLSQSMDRLKDQNKRQGDAFSKLVEQNNNQQQRITDLERENQLIARQLGDRLSQESDS
jgi:hypothetical protein